MALREHLISEIGARYIGPGRELKLFGLTFGSMDRTASPHSSIMFSTGSGTKKPQQSPCFPYRYPDSLNNRKGVSPGPGTQPAQALSWAGGGSETMLGTTAALSVPERFPTHQEGAERRVQIADITGDY